MNEYDIYFISWSEKKLYIIRGFTICNEYDIISLVYHIGNVSMYSYYILS